MSSTKEGHGELGLPVEFAVRRASTSDQDTILAILDEAARWLQSRGVSQWPAPFPSEVVVNDVACGRAWLATIGADPVGAVTLQDSDPRFWGDAAGSAVYVHRLAVRRSCAGLGRHILTWIESYARGLGRVCVRLDCVAANTALRGYYERAGYTCVGNVTIGVPSDPQALYEKRLD